MVHFLNFVLIIYRKTDISVTILFRIIQNNTFDCRGVIPTLPLANNNLKV